jgi:hypothetical protein
LAAYVHFATHTFLSCGRIHNTYIFVVTYESAQ